MDRIFDKITAALVPVADALASLPDYLLHPQSRLYWGYLLSAFVIAALVYGWHARPKGVSLQGLLDFLFPKSVWLHASALLDYRFAAVDAVLFALFLVPFGVSAYAVADQAGLALATVFGTADPASSAGPLGIFAFSLALVVVGGSFLTRPVFPGPCSAWGPCSS